MKPTLPEDRELEETGADVSRRYRAGPRDEPPPHLDAKILEAARKELRPANRRRDWQIPASIAAVVVVAVSLGVAVREHEPPLPTLDGAAAPAANGEAKLARPAPPDLATTAQPKQKAESLREARPSRERVERPDRQLLGPAGQAPKPEAQGSPSAPAADVPAQAPATSPAPAAPAEAEVAPLRREQSIGIRGLGDEEMKERDAAASPRAEDGNSKKVETAGALAKRNAAASAGLKPDDAPRPSPQEWIRKIEALLKSGRQADARDQLLAMRRQYPAYPLPETLQGLLGSPP